MGSSMGKIISQLRRQRAMTQLELAQKLGVTNQAVSKWESDQCCPDILLLPELADALGVSIDALFGRENRTQPRIQELPWPDDGHLRAVCFSGRTLVDQQPLRNMSVELHHSGNVNSIYSEFSVTCTQSTIHGSVNAKTGVICESIAGDVSAGDWVRCSGSIGGSVSAGNAVHCGNIGGNAFAGVSIDCRGIRQPDSEL